MPRVAYMWSDFPQMPELALELRHSLGWDPVLWLGHPHLEEPVARTFPGVPWQTIQDAHFCRPLNGVSSDQSPALDGDFWQRMQVHLPRLMSQMHRYGPPDHFLYDEREVFAHKLLLRWHELLTKTGVDIAFWEESPSVPFSYAAYVVCRDLGIATVTFYTTKASGLSLLREEVEGQPLRVKESYLRKLRGTSEESMAKNVQEAIESVLANSDFQHRSDLALAERERQHRDKTSPPGTQTPSRKPWTRPPHVVGSADRRTSKYLTKALRALNIFKWPLFLRNMLLRRAARREARAQESLETQCGALAYWKPKEAPMTDLLTRGYMVSHAAKRSAIKEHLRADYERRCSDPDYSKDNYVYFPLHYRPERTSNPDGGVFYDHVLALTMVSEALPEGWHLYVKEHSVQFNEVLAGECGRVTQYYDQIQRLRGVRLIHHETSSKRLVVRCQAVASITGTACWEAALLHKPGLYFGFPWYQGCPGTVRVSSADDVSAVLSNPGSEVATDEQLHAWHLALADSGFDFAFNAWKNTPGRFTPDAQMCGLRTALEWWHHNRWPAQASREQIHRT